MKKSIYILFALQFIMQNSYAQCNGSADLCSKQYNEVAYLTTHNAFNSDEDGLLFPNQSYNIASQLNDGVRGLMIDVYDYLEPQQPITPHSFLAPFHYLIYLMTSKHSLITTQMKL